jgi:large subunit ribosomal protein L20
MPRIKRGTVHKKRIKKVLRSAKGYRWGNKSKFRQAKVAMLHSWNQAFQARRKKKGVFRASWQVQINAAARENGVSYSKLIHGLKKQSIAIDRKILATLANEHPEIFKVLASKAE